MIVKDEAPVICRCLDSVRPLIDHWVIVDTGSTDGTQSLVRRHLHDLPGILVSRPWRDFATNRTQSLELARPRGDYALIVDADDYFEVPSGFVRPTLSADSYTVDIRGGDDIRYRRTQLVKNSLPWRYRGVLHEFLECAAATSVDHLAIPMRNVRDGARSRDATTYRRDAAVLERALATERDPFMISRYTFYLAQSYRDCGEAEKAVVHYLKRAEMGFWDQEVFISRYTAGRIMEHLGRGHAEVLEQYRRATEACPFRAEASYRASRLCRLADDFIGGYALAQKAVDLAIPPDGLFVEPWIYEYALLDELSVNAYWAGHYRESLDAALRALASGTVPADQHARFIANARFALAKLA